MIFQKKGISMKELQVKKAIGDKSFTRLLKSPAISACSLKESKTRRLSPDLKELCDRIKLISQGKKPGNSFNMNLGEIVVIADKLLEYKCVSTKQHNLLILNCLN